MITMESMEYQIYIGCRDAQSDSEIVPVHELKEMVSRFFSQRKIDFSIINAQGGYLHDNGWFITETSLCINIVEPSDFDIIKLARSLSMFMNQECSLIIRNTVKSDFLKVYHI